MINKYTYYLHRFITLGPRAATHRLLCKIKEQYLRSYWKRKAYANKAAHSWHHIARKHRYTKSFNDFISVLQKQRLSFLSDLYSDIDKSTIIAQAKQYQSNGFDLLGSGLYYFDTIDWHVDFRLQAKKRHADCYFDKRILYQERPIIVGKTDALVKDIKVPWELSRCYHFFVLGKAYQLTGDHSYAQTIYDHINSWLDNNPYLFGVNWMCPMEVGLRAVNWIIGYEFIAMFIPEGLQRFVCSLYDHLIYLENNWEVYDGRTSNHYLSNLIGYFYLCWFFKELPGFAHKRDWCYQELLKEWDKQIFDEGTDYEGSTAYHRLVTEIFYHFFLLCQEFGITVSRHYEKKLYRMIEFIQWCTPNHGNVVKIGDDDSGRVLHYGMPAEAFSKSLVPAAKNNNSNRKVTKHYNDFGLSIIKTELWHITMRHHAYQKKQPNGHYHVDVGSITVSLDGEPLFVDPGSFVYTPSVYWRNYFRRIQIHNTFFVANKEFVVVDQQLFNLALPEQAIFNECVSQEKNIITVTMQHDLYKSQGLCAQRKLYFNTQKDELIIVDEWLPINEAIQNNVILTQWNFTLGSAVEIHQEGSIIKLRYSNESYVIMRSGLNFVEKTGWYASHYGKKIRTKRLYTQQQLRLGQKAFIYVKKIK